MSTIAAGQLAGLDRPAALEFSFLLSIPTMIAATGWDLLQEIHTSKAAGAAGVAAAHVVMNRSAGSCSSSAPSSPSSSPWAWWSGFSIWVRKHGFTIFAIYRILLGGALLIWGAKLIGV